MSAKKPWFKARIGWACRTSDNCGKATFPTSPVAPLASLCSEIRVRVTDARELTAEKAVERVLKKAFQHHSAQYLDRLAREAGMSFEVKNGKVTVRRGKR